MVVQGLHNNKYRKGTKMKVFNGNKFLDAHQVTLELSNGYKAVVREIPADVMDALSKTEKESTESQSKQLREMMAQICGGESEDFDGLGIIEMRGAIDFLFENLFDMKSPK